MRNWIRYADVNGEHILLLVFYTTIVLVIGIEVLRRFVLSFSSLWGEEIARYSLIFLIWIGASYAVRTRTHIRIDLIFEFTPKKFHIWLYLLSEIATLIFAAFALYYSLVPISTSIQFGSVTEGLRVSRAFALTAVPLGFALVVLRVIQNIIRDLRDYAGGREIYAGKKLFE